METTILKQRACIYYTFSYDAKAGLVTLSAFAKKAASSTRGFPLSRVKFSPNFGENEDERSRELKIISLAKVKSDVFKFFRFQEAGERGKYDVFLKAYCDLSIDTEEKKASMVVSIDSTVLSFELDIEADMTEKEILRYAAHKFRPLMLFANEVGATIHQIENGQVYVKRFGTLYELIGKPYAKYVSLEENHKIVVHAEKGATIEEVLEIASKTNPWFGQALS